VALFSEQHSFTIHYTDIYSVVKPLYYVSVFFGLAPVCWSSEKKRGYIHAGLGVIKLFWTASLNLTMFPLMFHSMYLLLPKSRITTRIVGFATYHIPVYLCCITTMFVGLTVNRSKLPQLLYKIMQVDRVLIRKSIGPCMYRNTKSRLILQLVLVSTIVVTLCVLNLSSYCGLHCYYAYFGIFPFLVNTVEIIAWETKSHTHTKQLADYGFEYFNLYIPGQQAGW
jgi:hypothetical protein